MIEFNVNNCTNMFSPIEQLEMNRYTNLPTPPMSGSEDSQSPNYTVYDNSQVCLVNIPQFVNMTLTEECYLENVRLEILEQPVEKFRFRYKSEMAGTHGSLAGYGSEKNRKSTYPTVQVLNCKEPVIVRCALFQHNPHVDPALLQPHAHRLVQKQGNEEVDDPHDKEVTMQDEHVAVFNNMGIIHTARKYLVDELKKKKTKLRLEEIARTERIPRQLKTHEEVELNRKATEESKTINLNTVCLRFDAFIQNGDILYPICPPVFSHAINNLKSALTGELKIVRMDRCTSPANGGKEIYLLVEKVTKKNIKVRFFELDDEDNETWSSYAQFNDIDVHHQYAIVIKTPPYKVTNIDTNHKVYIELFRPGDGAKSSPLDFTYYPDQSARRKRPRRNYESSSSLSSSEYPLPVKELLPEIDFNSGNLPDFARGVDSSEFDEIYPVIQEFLTGNPDCIPMDQMGTNRLDTPFIRTEAEYRRGQELKKTDEELLTRSTNEMISLIKTKPKPDRIIKMMEKLLKREVNDEGNNVLHLAYSLPRKGKQNQKRIDLFLDLITAYRYYESLNIKNIDGDTVLHVALSNAENESVYRVDTLMKLADLTVKNHKGRSPLHVAIASNNNYEKLLKSKNVKDFVDLQNNDGYTAIQLAVYKNNLKAVRALSKYADINVIDGKDGANLLHMAIRDGYKDIVAYLLNSTDINIDACNFKDMDCHMLAKHLENRSDAHKSIYSIIKEKLKELGNFSEIFIKEEADTDDEMESDEIELKQEPMTEEELKESYGDKTEFTSKCLQQLSDILDEEDKWKALPTRLDLDFVLCPNLFEKDKYPTKSFIKLALAKGISVFQIRMALQDMDETEAYQCIDRMITGSTS